MHIASVQVNSLPHSAASNITHICIVTAFHRKWALCYRHFDHSGVDTNMLVERYMYIAISDKCTLSFHVYNYACTKVS